MPSCSSQCNLPSHKLSRSRHCPRLSQELKICGLKSQLTSPTKCHEIYYQSELKLHLLGIAKRVQVACHGFIHGHGTTAQHLDVRAWLWEEVFNHLL